jgi:succinyl-CoA synthetase alpha subunit
VPADALVSIRRDAYYDSVLLMRLSQALRRRAGVVQAEVVMGTPHNRELLVAAGFAGAALATAGPNDLVIAVRGRDITDADVEAELNALVAAGRTSATEETRPTTLAAALRDHPELNLVLISVPGAHAAREARHALARGKHVMIFSDNVPLEDEIALKRDAAARRLLMMGPDCGTAIINGKPLGFANAVRRGPIGVVGASGTGIQEITSCVHRLGGGVSQAIGTGGRDLSEAVGGTMTLFGIEALAADRRTKVIVVVSKPPSPTVAEKVVHALAAGGKPAVVHFVGAEPRSERERGRIVFADSLAGTARAACRLAGGGRVRTPTSNAALAKRLAGTLPRRAKLRALFCGGTTGHEALTLLSRAGVRVRSNLQKKASLWIEGTTPVRGHVLLDLGDDVFTRGRPHSMIEPVLRNERLALEIADPAVGVLLFDLVLGYGAHPDPAGVLAEGLEHARALHRQRRLVVIASVTGTDGDPQGLTAQTRTLASAGVIVMPDNAQASQLAAAVLARLAS